MKPINSVWIPRQVITHLLDYKDEGCELVQTEEIFNGKLLHRWLVGGTVLWSEEPAEEKQ